MIDWAPAFAHLFGIKPWQLDDLSFDEKAGFLTYAKAELGLTTSSGTVTKRRRPG